MKDIVLAIIDGDGLFYHTSKDTAGISMVEFDQRFKHILEETGATHYIAFCSFSPYFRHEIDPEYKMNRSKYKSPLKWLKTLKAYAIERYGFQHMKKVEADDLCAYWYNSIRLETSIQLNLLDMNNIAGSLSQIKNIKIKKVLCSPDKDLLNSIPGKHFNYTFKLENKLNPDSVIEGWWVETDNKCGQAEIFKASQLLLGDTTDNILGCGIRERKIYKSGAKKGQVYMAREGVKPKEADVILAKHQDNLDFLIVDVFNEYVSRFGPSEGTYLFQKNYRLLHLLESDQDFLREIGATPKFPKIIEVTVEEENENNVEF